MADLEVVAVITAKPGSADTIRAALVELVAETVKEPGCLSYRLSESTSAPGTFLTLELWKSQSDLDAHMATPHIAKAFATVGEHVLGAPVIHPLVSIA